MTDPSYYPDLEACEDCTSLVYRLTPPADWTTAEETEHRARIAQRWPVADYALVCCPGEERTFSYRPCDLCGSETPGERTEFVAIGNPGGTTDYHDDPDGPEEAGTPWGDLVDWIDTPILRRGRTWDDAHGERYLRLSGGERRTVDLADRLRDIRRDAAYVDRRYAARWAHALRSLADVLDAEVE